MPFIAAAVLSFFCTASSLTAIQYRLACLSWNASLSASAEWYVIQASEQCTSSAATLIAENSNEIWYYSQKWPFLNQEILSPYLKQFHLTEIAVGLAAKISAFQPVVSIPFLVRFVCLCSYQLHGLLHTNNYMFVMYKHQALCDYVQYSIS